MVNVHDLNLKHYCKYTLYFKEVIFPAMIIVKIAPQVIYQCLIYIILQ